VGVWLGLQHNAQRAALIIDALRGEAPTYAAVPAP
jgi:hypothetical protein